MLCTVGLARSLLEHLRGPGKRAGSSVQPAVCVLTKRTWQWAAQSLPRALCACHTCVQRGRYAATSPSRRHPRRARPLPMPCSSPHPAIPWPCTAQGREGKQAAPEDVAGLAAGSHLGTQVQQEQCCGARLGQLGRGGGLQENRPASAGPPRPAGSAQAVSVQRACTAALATVELVRGSDQLTGLHGCGVGEALLQTAGPWTCRRCRTRDGGRALSQHVVAQVCTLK